MLDGRLRPLTNRLLRPLALMIGDRLSPNQITLLALIPGLGTAVAAFYGASGVAVALWALNRLLDGVDGALARHTDRQSDLGGYLDLVLDFAVYAAVPVGMLAGGDPAARTALIALLVSFYVNAAAWMALAALMEKRASGATARGETTSIVMPPGLVGGAETVLLFTLMLAWPAGAPTVAWVMAAGVAISVAQRILWAARNLPALEAASGASE